MEQKVIYPERFPEGFQNIGNKTFEWVYDNKKDFVDFTLNEMTGCTGLFSQWQQYCQNKYKVEHGTPGTFVNTTP